MPRAEPWPVLDRTAAEQVDDVAAFEFQQPPDDHLLADRFEYRGAALRTLVIGASSSIDNCANGFSG